MPIRKSKKSTIQVLEQEAVAAGLLHESALDALEDAAEQTYLVAGTLQAHSDSRLATAAQLVTEGNRLAAISTALTPGQSEATIRSHFNK